jgi:hypothetical protein
VDTANAFHAEQACVEGDWTIQAAGKALMTARIYFIYEQAVTG